MYKAGVDVGSTTVKVVIFDDHEKLVFSRYERHFSDVKTATIKVVNHSYLRYRLEVGASWVLC